MSWLTQGIIDLKVRVRALFGRRGMRERIAEEMATHIAMREATLIAAGVSPRAAGRQARREFGNVAALRDSASDMWKYGTVERLVQDGRYGMRTLLRAPGFTGTAVLVLSLGIGATATVFTVIDAYLMRPLPVADADRVVRVYSNRFSNTSQRTFEVLRARNTTLEALAAFQMTSVGLRLDREIEHGFGQIVSGNYFPLLGIRPVRGRLLSPADDRPGAPPAVVLAHTFWQRRFAGSETAIGRTIAINDRGFTIVGVAPAGFIGAMAPLASDFWVPLGSDAVLRPALTNDQRLQSLSVHMLGRLKSDASLARAQTDLDTIGRQVRAERGESNRNAAVSVYPAGMLHTELERPLTAFMAVLMVVVVLALLIVCVNVANLVLARATSRQVELAIRQAIGAGRGRLIRQLLTENFLLALGGAIGGLLVALWLTRLLTAIPMSAPLPLAVDLSIDLRVVAVLLAAAVFVTLACGAAPALTASRVDLVRALKGASGGDLRHGRTRVAFLVVQVAMSVLLLVTAALFIRASNAAQSIDAGFDASHVLTASFDLEARGYTAETGPAFLDSLSERLNGAPGIVSSNAVDILPLTLSNDASYFLRRGEVPPTDGRSVTPIVYMNAVGPGHFRTLQIAMTSGRDFTIHDTARAPHVAIVNELLAQTFWPGQQAVGQVLAIADRPGESIEIVGVVRDSKYVTLGEDPRPFLYRPLAQHHTPRPTLLVRAAGAPLSVFSTLQAAVRDLDPGLPVYGATSMTDATAISILPVKIAGRLLAALGGLAVVLSALGTFGVLSFLVRSRSRELAIRLALGASPVALARMVVRQALGWTAIGASIGIAMTLAVTHLLASFLYGVNPRDPLAFAGVTALIASVACAAAFVPARRASRQDSLVTLRDA
jgi:putative ABC transport system permease protein